MGGKRYMQLVTSPPKTMFQLKIDLALLMNGLAFKYSNPHYVIEQEQVLQIFNHIVGPLVDLFYSYQLHISYTKNGKLFFKVFDQGSLSLFAW